MGLEIVKEPFVDSLGWDWVAALSKVAVKDESEERGATSSQTEATSLQIMSGLGEAEF